MAEAGPQQLPAAQSVHHELRNAENSAAFLLDHLSERRNDSLRILDAGAGSGTITVSFAKAFPNAQVTGVDIRSDILPRARAVAETAGVKNIEFQQADLFKLPFDDASFDVTFCHQVLTHVKAPEAALREMLRVTKDEGTCVVAVREGDYDTEAIWPNLSGLVKFHGLAASVMEGGGGTTTAGRQLVSWALNAGVNRSQITASFSSWSYHTPTDKQIWAQGLITHIKRGPMHERGIGAGWTADDLDDMATAWEDWAAREDSSLSMLHGEIIVKK
ncbi:S-adenosyl-L-methionine-dependent methyltransferase [Bimuria novae-zelandiae CBS 107.79]|uniref:S-adenosyl-L-methionine-dependent methyltransferase n=1 Tax=Bimuria novae-zelandiae CBS 107.79 TaxID=1447943 RepID=A0A6A5UP35_9PLEO|nr:S-adenosyl-L-methionine-dependent methyltransferase [Bimuria novae-zelandiae CBS 107.79]